MKRAVALIALLALAGTVTLVLGSSATASYRFAAIFDTAKGMAAGQQVKIAGAVVGTVDEIGLVAGPKARIVMSVEQRFAPFRQTATCTILPEGLISENYVQCDPGSRGPALAAGSGGIPTVPLHQTAIPFSLQDVLNVFSMPTDDRLRVLVSELGIGLAGRGDALSGLLQRSNPALVASQHVLSILDTQRQQLASAVGQTDQVLARIGAQSGQVRTFVDRAAVVAGTTATRRAELSLSVRGLPAMLDAARPALHSLDRAASKATPLLGDLHTASPGLLGLTRTLPSFATAGVPALKALASAATRGRPPVRAAVPVISHLQSASSQLAPLSSQLDALLVSLRDTGGIESTMQLVYTLAVLSSAYDSTSHLINFIASAAPQCLAGEGAGHNVAGCSHKYSAPGQGTVPINDTGCGPQGPQNFWDNAYCAGALPAGLPTLARHQTSGSTHARAVTPTVPPQPSTPVSGAPSSTPPSSSSTHGSGVGPVLALLGKVLTGSTGTTGTNGLARPLQSLLHYLLK
ncbi:MAG: MlaD family protein [Solirubrobacteraceae bacterium]